MLRGSVGKQSSGQWGGWRRNGWTVVHVKQGDLVGAKAVFMLGVSRRAGRTGVRAFVGARKRGNARGAKGRREVET